MPDQRASPRTNVKSRQLAVIANDRTGRRRGARVPATLDPHPAVALRFPAPGDPELVRALALPVTVDPRPVAVAPVPATGDPHEAGAGCGVLDPKRGRCRGRIRDAHRAAATARGHH